MNLNSTIKIFEELSLNNSIGHAYLFSNINYENIESEIENIISNYIFHSCLEISQNPDIYVIEPIKDVIKKEQIIDLENSISKTSQISNVKLYIIKQCDKLNIYAANSLLKTLEEPEKNVYAFLFTDNINQVFPTIKSRCQILNIEGNDIRNKYDENQIETVLRIINNIENNSNKAIAYDSLLLYKKESKEEIKSLLRLIEYFYKDCFNIMSGINIEKYKSNEKELKDVDKKNTLEKISKKVLIIDKNINLLRFNLNLNSFIDKILIELGRL